MATEKFKELEKIVVKHFSNANWDKKDQRWEAQTSPNKKDRWEKPESLQKFEDEANKKFYSNMSGSSWDDEGNITIGVRSNIFENATKVLGYSDFLNEKKPAGAPDWHDSDAPDAEGRFRDLGIKDLAAWLIKTRKKDVKKISGSLTQQIVFNRKEDPEYAEKMEKVRQEVYKQLGREDLLKEDATIDLGGAEPLEIKEMAGGLSLVQKSKIGSGKNVVVIPDEFLADLILKLKFYQFHGRIHENTQD